MADELKEDNKENKMGVRITCCFCWEIYEGKNEEELVNNGDLKIAGGRFLCGKCEGKELMIEKRQ